MSVLCSMLYLYFCSLLVVIVLWLQKHTDVFPCSRPFKHTCETCSSHAADLYHRNTAEIFKWSQLKVAPVYIGTVVTLRYDDCVTNGPGQRGRDSVHFLLCYMISAQLCIYWQEPYNVRLCCRQYPLFPSFLQTLPLSAFFRSSRLIGWWKLWTRQLKVFTHTTLMSPFSQKWASLWIYLSQAKSTFSS